MRIENIQDMVHRTPFKPIELELDNGRKIKVKHPELIFFNQAKTSVIVTEGVHFHILDTDHIVAINSVLR